MIENYFEPCDEVLTKFGENSDDDLGYLIAAIKENNLNVDIELITKAFEFSYNLNHNKKRASGVPYYTHTLSVALIIVEELKIGDTTMIITALLHNVLKDYEHINLPYIRKEFGQPVALLLSRFTRIGKYTKEKETGTSPLRLLFLSLIRDARIFGIQICNRLHDIRTLKYMPEYYKKNTAQETLNFYVPFANKFGLSQIQRELEIRSFYFYNPTQYKKNIDYLKIRRKLYSESIYTIIEYIRTILDNRNIKSNIHIQQMQEYELFLHISSNKTNVDNIFSINIIVDGKDNEKNKCNEVFDILAAELKHKEFLDINNNPIAEFDNSITLQVYTHSGKVKVNIRTQEMDYNLKNKIQRQIEKNQINLIEHHFSFYDTKLWTDWMQYIIDSYSRDKSEEIIWQSLKNNLYNEKIIINTISYEKNILPIKSTAVDLAFNLSETIGLSAISCKINGTIVSLFTELKNGDVVEIITSPNCKPDSSWLNYVVTYKAIAYLTNYFRNKYEVNKSVEKFVPNLNKKIIITTKRNNNILSNVSSIIGKENINKITFANDANNFIMAIKTNIDSKSCTNQIFLDIIKIKGVKKIDIKNY